MRMSRDAMARHRKDIVAAASRMMRERGISATSVADLMQAANLTHGGFYRHFESKDALAAEAIAAAFDDHVRGLGTNIEKLGPEAAVEDYVGDYLTRRHLTRPGFGCPMAALGGDGAREAKVVQEAFAGGTRKLIDRLAAAQTGAPAERRAAAIRLLATIVGAVVMSRAVGEADLGDEILAASRERPAP
jgi:TetR/AcrR family transcriptional regulator, transcriptional repressor for nem operon